MRAREFMREDASAGATVAGSMAPVAQPVGGVIARQALGAPAKYMNTFKSGKKRRRHASR